MKHSFLEYAFLENKINVREISDRLKNSSTASSIGKLGSGL